MAKPADQTEAEGKIRLDKWLWQARFFKTRTLASKVCAGGHVRLDGRHVKRASQMVMVGQILTFAQARDVRVVEILALSERRGPASEAQTLYRDLTALGDAAEADEAASSGSAARLGGEPEAGDTQGTATVTGKAASKPAGQAKPNKPGATHAASPRRERGAGRPTKAERRATDRLRGTDF